MADRWTYRPELDGLRSVAVYLVVLFHCGVGPFDGGFVGVDLFFVLSGFLVSHVIWAEVDKHGSFRLGWFYARRVRRLLPAAVVVIVATAALQLLVASAPQRAGMLRDGQAALVYLSNWQFIADSRDYFAADEASASPFLHYWSLSIEEQFYVVLPLALLLLLRLRRHAVVVLLVLAAVVAGSVALQVWHAASDPTYAYYATGTRVYQLAAGVLLASITRLVTIPSGLGRVLSVVGLAGVVVVGSAVVDVTASTSGLLATVASLAVIAGLFAAPTGEAARVLALRVPRYLGQVSYGTYLWHWPIILILRQLFDVGPLVLLALAAPVATGLAALSYEIFERPDPPHQAPRPVPLARRRGRPRRQRPRGHAGPAADPALHRAPGSGQPRGRRPFGPRRAGGVGRGPCAARTRPRGRTCRRTGRRPAVHNGRPRGVRAGHRRRPSRAARR